MSSVAVMIDLPEDLVRRAREQGIRLEDQTAFLIEALEAEIQRREAASYLAALAEQLRALPDDQKPTPEEIEAEFAAYWQEMNEHAARSA
jgi:hypothetical protein